jgi:hypothetical protein
MKIHFSVSEAQIVPHEETGIPPIDPNQVAFMTIETDAVEVTYDCLRVGEHGETIAVVDADTGFWVMVREVEPITLDDHNGEPNTEVTKTSGLKFTDWSVTA